MKNLRTIALLAAIAGALAATILALASTASAHDVTPGGPCGKSQVGTHRYHGRDKYQCRETKPNCWIWKFDGLITGQWTGGPTKCSKCKPKPSTSTSTFTSTSATPSQSRSPSATPSASRGVTPSRSTTGGASTAVTPTGTTTPVDTTLPITGPSWAPWALGGALVLCGLALYLAARESCRNGRKHAKES